MKMSRYQFISKYLNKLAVSNAIKQEIVNRFGSKPNFPKENLDSTLDQIEKLVPTGNKAKTYILWLSNQLWGITPPGFVLGEDDARVKPLIYNFDEAVNKKKLSGPQADINKYKDLESIQKAVGEEEKEPEGMVEYTDEQKAIVEKGSEVIYNQGGWVVYRINKGNNKDHFAAAKLLCDNDIHNVGWCVGRGTTSYLVEGNFYVVEKNGRSKYAISTDANSATIWNPSDTPVWTTSGTGGDFHNIARAAISLGIKLDFSTLSSLPRELVPLMKEVVPKDPYLAERIPADQLTEGDTGPLDKVLFGMDKSKIIEDLNENFSSHRTVGSAAAIMGRCIALKMDFAGTYDNFSEETMLAYIELLAAAGYKSLPKSFEDYIVSELEKGAEG